jgi:tRNA (mo5U34)-methyltransferase
MAMFYRRVAKIIADDGFAGLWPHVKSRFSSRRPNTRDKTRQHVLDEYQRSVSVFRHRVADLNIPGLDRFYWYHVVDLGNGLVTPGARDFRGDLAHFRFPENMSNMRVLDVGSATGFFAFEFEKRGAAVTSVELPSVADWDMPLSEDRAATLKELMNFHGANTLEELQYLHLDGPFLFCHEQLRSNVERLHSTIYDLTPHKFSTAQFDIVFLGDILLHIFSPLKALSTVAPLCKDRLIILHQFPHVDESQPLMLYIGGQSPHGDSRSWWLPNKTCLVQILKRVGFRTVEITGHFETIDRSNGIRGPRSVIHAAK